MKLTVLGSGITTTTPGIGFRFSAAHLVESADTKILLDAGIGVLPQLAAKDIPITDIDAVCITHYHADHFVLEPILQALFVHARNSGQRLALQILGPSDIEERVRIGYQTKGWRVDADLLQACDITFTPYQNGQSIALSKDLSLTPYQTEHGPLEAYSLRLVEGDRVLVYSGDSIKAPGLEQAAAGATIFLCESTYDLKHPGDTYHLSLTQAAEVARDQAVKRLVFTHYSGQDSPEAMIEAAQQAGFTGEVAVARDLDEFEV